jgi:hypothetical protein
MPAPLRPVQSRLLGMLLERVADWVSTSPDVSRVSKAKVTAVLPGAAAGGTTLVTIQYQGASGLNAPYLSSYTPVLDDVVAVARTGSQLLILGRIVGTPPE